MIWFVISINDIIIIFFIPSVLIIYISSSQSHTEIMSCKSSVRVCVQHFEFL